MQSLLKKSVWLQILFWGSFWIAIPTLLSGSMDNPERHLVRSAVVFGGIALVVLLNLELLLPRLFFNKKQGWYVLAGMLLVVLLTALLFWDLMPWEPYFNRSAMRKSGHVRKYQDGIKVMRYVGAAMPFLTTLLGTALYEIAGYANRKEKEASEYKSEKLEAELKFLRSQINPHFLFNALNNIYTLTVIKSDQAPDNLLKLSGMLRYMLYECKADTVPLIKEIEYLKNFIDLHLLKDSRGLKVQADLDESRPNLVIAPMLLIPFVENAFKHSNIEDLNNGWINISLTTAEKSLEFRVENSLPAAGVSKDKVGGIGLENVKRQLELQYPERFVLDIDQSENAYRILLKLQLS